MEVRFYIVYLDGERVTDMSKHEDAIFDLLTHVTDEKDEVCLGDGWFSLSDMPTLNEMLVISRGLAKLGLVIDV